MAGSQETGPILVVIDMQTKFPASRHQTTLENCAREIKQAMDKHQRILFLEYVDGGETQSKLIELVQCPCDSRSCKQSYDRYWVSTKFEDDGSRTILDYLKRIKRSEGKVSFTICGVNTDACVRSTVLGLAKRKKDALIRVVKDACHQPKKWKERYPFEKMQKAKNVEVI